MAGSRDTTGNRGDVGAGGIFASLDVKERLIIALLAVILGGGGAVGTLNIIPDKTLEQKARPDPWTGSDARSAHKEMVADYERQIANLEADIKALRATLQQHLVRGEAGFVRIQRLEEDVRELKEEYK